MRLWGVLLLIVLWALPTAWVGKQAAARGRLELVWAPIAALVGLAGFGLGASLVYRWIDLDAPLGFLALMSMLPVVLMLAGLFGVGAYVRSRPINVASGAARWKVHVVGRGEGTVRIDGDDIVLAWADGDRRAARTAIRATADGETVRLVIDGDELALMPLGKPDSAEGRRVQSQQLARRLAG